MGKLRKAVLLDQLHALSADGLTVSTAQRWTYPAAPAARPVSWASLVRNGTMQELSEFRGVAAQEQLEQNWRRLIEMYEPTRLTEDQMWSRLRELTGIEQSKCAGAGPCRGELPVAWPYCPACGRDQRNVSSGSLSGTRRRGLLILDLRKPQS